MVKTSVFFLSNWTIKFQKRIANYLVRKVYSPDEVLLQTRGKEKIYILSQGKVDIEADFFGHKKLSKLEANPTKEVHFNVFGYSSLISGLKVKLRAVARDYSVCFSVSKENLLSAIKDS